MALGGRPVSQADPHDQILLIAAKDRADAVAVLLSTKGITSSARPRAAVVLEYGGMLGGTEVCVRQEDLGRARELLDMHHIAWTPPPERRIGF